MKLSPSLPLRRVIVNTRIQGHFLPFYKIDKNNTADECQVASCKTIIKICSKNEIRGISDRLVLSVFLLLKIADEYLLQVKHVSKN